MEDNSFPWPRLEEDDNVGMAVFETEKVEDDDDETGIGCLVVFCTEERRVILLVMDKASWSMDDVGWFEDGIVVVVIG